LAFLITLSRRFGKNIFLYAEIVLKVANSFCQRRNTIQDYSKRSETGFKLSEEFVAGDFSLRLELAFRSVIDHIRTAPAGWLGLAAGQEGSPKTSCLRIARSASWKAAIRWSKKRQ
jgi:hypothetical protein